MGILRALSRWEKALLILFACSLPLLQPRVQGDGIGYYAFARSLLVDGNLQFATDWQVHDANSFAGIGSRLGQPIPRPLTPTGHVDNYFAVGPAILWAPALAVTHLAVLAWDRLGGQVPADGYSRPYMITLALATAVYSFLALWLSFRLAREYFRERWAFLATLAIWLASALPAYIYCQPSWAHAHSAFVVALFLWYGQRTRPGRRVLQWMLLGLISGLMLDVYYPNAILLLVPLLDLFQGFAPAGRQPAPVAARLSRRLGVGLLYLGALAAGLLPTLLAHDVLYGSPWRFGIYTQLHWNWAAPALAGVLTSSDHGLLSWSPILIPALAGLWMLFRRDRRMGGSLLAACLGFYYLIASYAYWDAVLSFGNRFFISLTPVFVVGLAGALQACERLWPQPRAMLARVAPVLLALILWNLGLLYQWDHHIIPQRGPVSWQEVLYNQFRVVPGELFRSEASRASLGGFPKPQLGHSP